MSAINAERSAALLVMLFNGRFMLEISQPIYWVPYWSHSPTLRAETRQQFSVLSWNLEENFKTRKLKRSRSVKYFLSNRSTCWNPGSRILSVTVENQVHKKMKKRKNDPRRILCFIGISSWKNKKRSVFQTSITGKKCFRNIRASHHMVSRIFNP